MAGELLKNIWTLTLAGERVSLLTCDLFETHQGFEVRCSNGDEVLQTARVASVADAINLCEAWKAVYRVRGWNELSE